MAQFQNFFAAKLANDIGAADTAINLDTAPSATSGRMVLEARNPTQREVIKYTGVVGNQLTGVTRGQGGTTAKTHTQNSLVEMNMTAEDLQDLYDAFGSFAATNNDWRSLVNVPTIATGYYKGQKEFELPFNGVDLRPLVGKGTRLRFNIAGTIPTQRASLNGTNQYFNKATPTGHSYTNNFSVRAKFNLDDYPANQYCFHARLDAAANNGWYMGVDASGRVFLAGYNSGNANARFFQSIESVILKQDNDVVIVWGTGGAGVVYINGVPVDMKTGGGGTNPTSIAQPAAATDYMIGARPTPTSFMKGQLQHVEVWSKALTAQEVLDLSYKQTTGAEANLVGSYPLNGNANDLTANANNLTPQGGAGYVTANTYHATEYAISTKEVAYSGGNSIVTVTTGTDYNIPNATISSVAYSTAKAPYGFPADEDKWTLKAAMAYYSDTYAIGAFQQWLSTNFGIRVPSGKWEINMDGVVQGNGNANSAMHFDFILAAPTPTNANRSYKPFGIAYTHASVQLVLNNVFSKDMVDLATPTTYRIYGDSQTAGGAVSFLLRGDYGSFTLRAKCPYI